MKTFGLIGYPLGHSFSKKFFDGKFQSEGILAQYLNFEIPTIKELPFLLRKESNLKGFNVTIPYKETIIPFLDQISEEAQSIKAVNVVKVIRDNQNNTILKGFNSDIYGFVESLKPLLKPHHQGALVLGSGGASKAICYGLKSLHIKSIVVSRTPQKEEIHYEEITPHLLEEFKLIINCTPLGTYPNIEQRPNIPYSLLNDNHLLYDLVYNPYETSFLKEGKAQGATIKNGLEMLHLQAIKAWQIWTDDET